MIADEKKRANKKAIIKKQFCIYVRNKHDVIYINASNEINRISITQIILQRFVARNTMREKQNTK